MSRAALSDSARQIRRLIWLVGLVAVAAASVFVLGARGVISRPTGALGGGVLVVALAAVVRLGRQGYRQAIADRERQSKLAMTVALTAQLGQQDDATLARLATQRGTIGEVARGVLAGRAQRAGRGAGPDATPDAPPAST